MDIILENKLQIIVVTVITAIVYIILSAKQRQEEEQKHKHQPLQHKQPIVPSGTGTTDDAASYTVASPIGKQESTTVNNKTTASSEDQFVKQKKSELGREAQLKTSVLLDEINNNNNITNQETSSETVVPVKNEKRNEKPATVVIDSTGPAVTKKQAIHIQNIEPPVGLIGERLQYRTDRQVINNKSPAKPESNTSKDEPKLIIHKKTRVSMVIRRPKTKTNQKSLKEAMKDADQLLSKVQSIDLPSGDKPLPSSDESQESEVPKKSLEQILAKSGGNLGPNPMGGFNLAALTNARNKLKKANVTSGEDDMYKNEYENA
jgi:hypothetical protein